MKNLKRIEGNKKLDPIKIASTKASNFHNPSRNGRNKKIETTVESNFLKFVKEKRRIERPILFSLETVTIFSESKQKKKIGESNYWIDRGSKRGK